MIDWRSPKTLVAVVGTAALLSGCGFNSATGETRNETLSFDLDDKAAAARVDIRMGAGDLKVATGTAKFMEGKFAYNIPEWKPEGDYKVDDRDGTAHLTLTQPGYSSSFGNSVNNWDVTFNGDIPLEFTANLGAGEANLELGQMNLTRVDLTIGAGEMNVDLRGEPKRDYTVQIRGGVGETTVQLPKDVAISATATKGIGDISVEGLEERSGVWVNPDRIGAPVTVRLDVKGGVGQINLKR
ncbi:MAG TPA: toast rack family protein [Vicinamibacterales bacterium]|nr:toast rack family protein [Vicinamibacterales bacterium]